MELYGFYASFYGEKLVGVVKANSESEARQILKKIYDDYDCWEVTIKKIKFNSNNLCEIYYGC